MVNLNRDMLDFLAQSGNTHASLRGLERPDLQARCLAILDPLPKPLPGAIDRLRERQKAAASAPVAPSTPAASAQGTEARSQAAAGQHEPARKAESSSDDEDGDAEGAPGRAERRAAALLARAAAARERGNEAFRRSDLPSALKLYNMAVRLDPRDALSYSNRAAVRLKAGDWDEAEQASPSCKPKRNQRFARQYLSVQSFSLFYGRS